MSSRQRRILIRRHKETITVWRVQARLDGWTDEYVAGHTDFELALMLERYGRLPNLDIPLFRRFSTYNINTQTK